MKTAFILSVILAVLTMSTAIPLACSENRAGQLPTWNMGDRWVYQGLSGGTSYTITEEVTDEAVFDGQDCWVMTLSVSPSTLAFSATQEMDKKTLYSLHVQSIGLEVEASYSYQFPGDEPWPLKVGKEYTVAKTTTSSTYLSEGETETTTRLYRVEAVEEVTVPAGRFSCFRVVEYDDTGKQISVSWQSDQVKQRVKYVESDDRNALELQSYSV